MIYQKFLMNPVHPDCLVRTDQMGVPVSLVSLEKKDLKVEKVNPLKEVKKVQLDPKVCQVKMAQMVHSDQRGYKATQVAVTRIYFVDF